MDERYERAFAEKQRRKDKQRIKGKKKSHEEVPKYKEVPMSEKRRKKFAEGPRYEPPPEARPPRGAPPPPPINRVVYLAVLGLTVEDDVQIRIRSSYRRLALQYHPDKNPSPDACEIFKKIVDAYEKLSSESSR